MHVWAGGRDSAQQRIPDALKRYPGKLEQSYYYVIGPHGHELFPPTSRIAHTAKAVMIKAYGTVFTFRKGEVQVIKRHLIAGDEHSVDVDSDTPSKDVKHADDAVDVDLPNGRYPQCADCVSIAKLPNYSKHPEAYAAMLTDIGLAGSGAANDTSSMRSEQSLYCDNWDPFYYSPSCYWAPDYYVGVIWFPTFYTARYGDVTKYDYTSHPLHPAEGFSAYEVAVPSVYPPYVVTSTFWGIGFDAPLYYQANVPIGASNAGPNDWEYVDWYGDQVGFTQTTETLVDNPYASATQLVYKSGGAFSWGYKLFY